MTFKPSAFDRALLTVAPTLGLKRLRARAAAFELTRAFDGASRDRRLGNWRASAAGPNAETERAGELLRYRARDLAQNNKAVSAAKLQFIGQTIGTGITPRAVHRSKNKRQAAEDAWARFVDTCDPDGQQDYYGLQATTAGSMFIDGECLQVWLKDRAGVPNSQVKLLEADHFDENQTTLIAGRDPRITRGIEFDDWGRRVAYWLHRVHPGETDVFRLNIKPDRIPAEDIDHYYHITRPGQIRGVSWLAPAIVSLRAADDVKEAMIWRKRIEACIGIIINTPEAQGAATVIGTQATNNGRLEETMRPGGMYRFGPGESAEAFQPSPSGDTMEFLRAELYAFCATAGLAYHEVSGDASQANYSSMRAAKIAGYVLMDLVQWIVLAPRIKAAWRRVMAREYALTGDRALLAVGCELAMPHRPWVDPLKDVMAKILEIRAGLQAHPDALAERGIVMDKFLADVKAWAESLDALGIVFDTDARQVDRSGALQQLQTAASVAGDKQAQQG